MKTTSTRLAAFLAAFMLLLAPASALAADSSLEGYAGPGAQEQSQVAGVDQGPAEATQATQAARDTTGDLPFTGLDLALIGGAGMVLLGLGIGLRQLARTRPAHSPNTLS